jgi:hypothetical protein
MGNISFYGSNLRLDYGIASESLGAERVGRAHTIS